MDQYIHVVNQWANWQIGLIFVLKSRPSETILCTRFTSEKDRVHDMGRGGEGECDSGVLSTEQLPLPLSPTMLWYYTKMKGEWDLGVNNEKIVHVWHSPYKQKSMQLRLNNENSWWSCPAIYVCAFFSVQPFKNKEKVGHHPSFLKKYKFKRVLHMTSGRETPRAAHTLTDLPYVLCIILAWSNFSLNVRSLTFDHQTKRILSGNIWSFPKH